MIKKYLFGLSTGLFLLFIQIGIGLFLTPYSLKFLSREEFAIFQIAYDVIIWMSILNLGTQGSFISLVSKRINDIDYVSKLSSTMFTVKIILAFTGFFIGLIIAINFDQIFELSFSLANQAQWALILLSLSFSISIIDSLFSELMQINYKIHENNLFKVIANIIRAIIVIFLLINDLKILALASAYLICEILIAAFSIARVKLTLKEIIINPFYFSKDIYKNTYKISLWFFINGLASMLILQLDKFIVGKIIGLGAVTTMVLTNSLFNIGHNLIIQYSRNARPYLGRSFGAKESYKAYDIFATLLKFSTGSAIIFGFSAFLVNEAFVSAWVGPQNYGGDWLALALLSNFIFNAYILPQRISLSANLRIRPLSIIRICEGFLNLILSILLGRQLGIIGVVIATSISMTISIVLLPYLNFKSFKKNLLDFFVYDNLKMLSFLAIYGIFILLLKNIIVIQKDFLIIGLYFSVSLLLGAMLLFMFYYKDFNAFYSQWNFKEF